MTVLKVRDLMTAPVETLEKQDDLDLASMAMRMDQVRHLPILDGGSVVGILTDRDILRSSLSDVAGNTTSEIRMANLRRDVADVMTPDVVTVGPDAPALEAAKLMRKNRIGGIPVVEDGGLVGIITETDFLDYAIRELSDPA